MVARNSWVKENPTTVKLIDQALLRAQQYLEHHVYNRYDYNKKLCKYDYQPVDGYIAVPDFPGIGNELTDYCFTNGKVTTVE